MPFGKLIIQSNRFERRRLRLGKRLFRLHSEEICQLDQAFCQSGVRGRIFGIGLNRPLKMLNRLALCFFRQNSRKVLPFRYSE